MHFQFFVHHLASSFIPLLSTLPRLHCYWPPPRICLQKQWTLKQLLSALLFYDVLNTINKYMKNNNRNGGRHSRLSSPKVPQRWDAVRRQQQLKEQQHKADDSESTKRHKASYNKKKTLIHVAHLECFYLMDFSKTLRTVEKTDRTLVSQEWVLYFQIVDLVQVLVALWQLISPKKHCARSLWKTNLTRTSIENEFPSAAPPSHHSTPTSTPLLLLFFCLLDFWGPRL